MSFFRIKTTAGKTTYVNHEPGSQAVYDEIDRIVGEKPHPVTGVPQSIEFDGWADDQAYIGDVRETEDYTIECISEEEYREETGQKYVPRNKLA